jgi:FKBP-type peptidyl-prolyl cis-trans isomerase FklB
VPHQVSAGWRHCGGLRLGELSAWGRADRAQKRDKSWVKFLYLPGLLYFCASSKGYMKKTLVFCLFAVISYGLNAQTTPLLKNSVDSASYALGQLVGLNLKEQTTAGLNVDILLKAMESALKGESQLFDPQQAETIFVAFNEAAAKAKNEKVRAESQKFLDENKKRAGVTTTASGLQYEVLKQGTTQVSPKATDQVKVHYHGTLMDGSIFDSSVDRGEPITFGLDQVISGWTEGVQLMHVGDKFKFYIPSELAYGEGSPTPAIPGGSMLIFEVELLEIVPQ